MGGMLWGISGCGTPPAHPWGLVTAVPVVGAGQSLTSCPRCPGEALAQLCTSDDSCEVDPSKCAGPDLSDNQNNLRQVCEETFQRIATSCE